MLDLNHSYDIFLPVRLIGAEKDIEDILRTFLVSFHIMDS